MNLLDDLVPSGALANGPAPPKQPGPGNGRLSPECAPTLTPLTGRLYTLADARRILDNPVLDHRYRETALGPHVVAWLTYLELGGKAASTLDQYERDLARGCLMYPTHGIDRFGDDEMAEVAKSFKPASRRERVAAWRSFYKWALKKRLVTLNPCDALPDMKRRSKQVYDLFTQAEQHALCGLPIRDGALFTLMFEAGPRKGDCIPFQFGSWRSDPTPDMPYGGFAFLGAKGDKNRIVPASEAAARAVAELSLLEGLNRNDHLWYTRPGGGSMIKRATPMTTTSFQRWWTRSLAEAGVRYRNPHMTRHTFATGYLRGGGRLETLQLVLGHASIKTTADEYGHLDMRDVARDMGLIGLEQTALSQKSPDGVF
jgi:integrase